MAAASYFAVKDYDLTSRLQVLFLKYTVLNAEIHNARSNKTGTDTEIFELASQLREAVSEINLLVMKMRQLRSGAEIVENNSHQTINEAKRNHRITYIQ
jgi:hypothetical protein